MDYNGQSVMFSEGTPIFVGDFGVEINLNLNSSSQVTGTQGMNRMGGAHFVSLPFQRILNRSKWMILLFV